MTSKELLIHEVQTLPENLAEQVLDYVQYLKIKKVTPMFCQREGRQIIYRNLQAQSVKKI